MATIPTAGAVIWRGALRGAIAVKRLFVRPPRGLRGEKLREWIHAQPGLVEDTKAGFKDIREGRYRDARPRSERT